MRYMMGIEPLALVFKLLFMTVRTHFGELCIVAHVARSGRLRIDAVICS